MHLQACLNGARRPDEHPALPVTPAALARDAAKARAAGAASVHLHVKDVDGSDTLAPGPLAVVLDAIRREAPGVPVGVTTGAWAVPDADERFRVVRSWAVLPDFASVNWHEEGAERLAAALLEAGVAVEAGLWDEDAVGRWAASPLRERCLRVLLELPDAPYDRDVAERMLHRVSGAPAVLLHGEGESAWPALQHAAALGLAARIGLEDVLHLPDGRRAPDNASLVRTGRLLQAMRGRPVG